MTDAKGRTDSGWMPLREIEETGRAAGRLALAVVGFHVLFLGVGGLILYCALYLEWDLSSEQRWALAVLAAAGVILALGLGWKVYRRPLRERPALDTLSPLSVKLSVPSESELVVLIEQQVSRLASIDSLEVSLEYAEHETGYEYDAGACYPVLSERRLWSTARRWERVPVPPDGLIRREVRFDIPDDEALRIASGSRSLLAGLGRLLSSFKETERSMAWQIRVLARGPDGLSLERLFAIPPLHEDGKGS